MNNLHKQSSSVQKSEGRQGNQDFNALKLKDGSSGLKFKKQFSRVSTGALNDSASRHASINDSTN